MRSTRLAAGVGATALVGYWFPSVCVLGQFSPVALRALPSGLCTWRGPSSSGSVALTFDDGPSPDNTPRTLEILDALSLRATFFLLGTLAETHRSLVGEILARGHSVGVHGYVHEHHLLRSPAWVRRDFARSVKALEDTTGASPRWYRPTYGQLTSQSVLEARRQNMHTVLWSAWGREWAESEPEKVMARVDRKLGAGAIVLLHDNEVNSPRGTAALTHATLELLARRLDELDLKTVTLDELLPARGA